MTAASLLAAISPCARPIDAIGKGEEIVFAYEQQPALAARKAGTRVLPLPCKAVPKPGGRLLEKLLRPGVWYCL